VDSGSGPIGYSLLHCDLGLIWCVINVPKQLNPLRGLSVPSVDEIADAILERFERLGIVTIDLRQASQRDQFRKYLRTALRTSIQFKLDRVLTRACAKAIEHVMRLMEDPDYQEHRAKRRKEALAARKIRKAARLAEQQIEIESRRQQRRGVIQ